MKHCLLVGLIFLASVKIALGAEGTFSQSISSDDLKTTGLNRLSPAELKRLDELIAAYKAGDVAAARRTADEAIQAKKVAEAEAKAAKAEVVESKKSNQGFLAKAKVLLVPGSQIEYAVIKTTIAGKFEGWDGRAVFHLANGQSWQIVNSDEHYFTTPKENVEVEISAAALGGFWMDFPAFRKRVRVRLLGDK